jgi:hypothetical protein
MLCAEIRRADDSAKRNEYAITGLVSHAPQLSYFPSK